MSMSTTVVGFKPPDDTWQRMKSVWDACKKAGIDIPELVDAYFCGEAPDPAGVEVSQQELIERGAIRAWEDNKLNAEGCEIDVSKIPADVKIIRFYNSW